MDELVVWLRAQLDEDERIAREAGASVGPVLGAMDWRLAESGSDEGGRYWRITTVPPNDTVPTVELVGSGMSGGGVHEEALGRHIVAHDPARVLREIDAKRRIIGRINSHAAVMGWDEVHGDLLRSLALPYADRPGYREEWRL
jgi:hypothetical protein